MSTAPATRLPTLNADKLRQTPKLGPAASLLFCTLISFTPSTWSSVWTIASDAPVFDCNAPPGVVPGDTVVIESGVRDALIIRNCAGTADAPITIQNDRSGTGPVVIRNAKPSKGSGFVFQIQNARHVVIDGTGGWKGMPDGAYCGAPNGTTGCGIQIVSTAPGDSPTAYMAIRGGPGRDAINMRDQVIKGIMIDGSGSFGGAGGPRIGLSFNDHRISANRFPEVWRENITIEQNYITNVWNEGLYIGPNWIAGTPRGNVHRLRNIFIRRNLIVHTGWEGLNLKSCIEGMCLVEGNYCLQCGVRSDRKGAQDGLASWEGGATFTGNYVLESGETGIAAGTGRSRGAGPWQVQVYNNVIVDAGATGPTPGHGISVAPGQDGAQLRAEIFNNTVVNAEGSGIFVGANVVHGLVRNNLVAGEQGRPITIRSRAVQSESNSIGSASSFRFHDPSSHDYRLTFGSPAIDASTNPWPATDFAGQVRHNGTAGDDGAFEWTGHGSQNSSELPLNPHSQNDAPQESVEGEK